MEYNDDANRIGMEALSKTSGPLSTRPGKPATRSLTMAPP